MKDFTLKLSSIAIAGVLALAGCGASNSGGGDNSDTSGNSATGTDWSACTPGEDAKSVAEVGEDAKTEISIGVFNGWDESFASAYLVKAALESEGYTVSLQQLDAGPAFTAVSNGDVDVITDGWLPLTHEDYLQQFGDQIDPAGCWYNNAKLTIAVNEDSPAKTIADLKDMADEYGSRLIGIEPGAGLTRTTKDSAIPTYELGDYDFIESSTPAMLSELKKATDSGENIAVTLWRPHWAYGAFPIRDLEDPEGAMGGAEVIYNFTTKGFADENPMTAQLLKNLVLDDDQLSSLESLMFSEDAYAGKDLDQAVQEWLEANSNFMDDWKNGELG